ILSGDLSVLRFADPRLHAQTNCVEINYRILCIRGRTVIADIKEKHHVRFFFLPELIEFLKQHNMEIQHFCRWMHLDEPPSTDDWNACIVARKC
ncbi:MAG: hypothetical protein ABIG67_04200, partial [Pseudomonadota bacterium]